MKSATLSFFARGVRLLFLAGLSGAPLAASESNVADDVRLEGKVLFLGDSITHAGHYVSAS